MYTDTALSRGGSFVYDPYARVVWWKCRWLGCKAASCVFVSFARFGRSRREMCLCVCMHRRLEVRRRDEVMLQWVVYRGEEKVLKKIAVKDDLSIQRSGCNCFVRSVCTILNQFCIT